MPPASYFNHVPCYPPPLLTVKKSAGLRTFSFGFTLQTLMSLGQLLFLNRNLEFHLRMKTLRYLPEPGLWNEPTNKSRRLRVKNSQCVLPAFTETIADISDVRAEWWCWILLSNWDETNRSSNIQQKVKNKRCFCVSATEECGFRPWCEAEIQLSTHLCLSVTLNSFHFYCTAPIHNCSRLQQL